MENELNKPEAGGNSPGSEYVAEGFETLLSEAQKKTTPEPDPGQKRKPGRKGKKVARRVPRGTRQAATVEPSTADAPDAPDAQAPLDFGFIRTLAALPFKIGAMFTGKPLELTDAETDRVAVALAPVAEKYLPGVIGTAGPEINLALVAGSIYIEKAGLFAPDAEPDGAPGSESEPAPAPAPMRSPLRSLAVGA